MFRTQVMMLYLSRFSPHSNLRDFPLGCHPGRLSRFHTSDFFCSNAGFHVLANLDFSLSPILTVCAHSLFQIPARGFPCFSTDAARDCRRFRCFSPDFDAGLRRLVAAVDGSGHYKLFLQTLHHPSQPSLITSA